MGEAGRPKSTLSERLNEQATKVGGGGMYLQGSGQKNSSSQKKQRPAGGFIQKSTQKASAHSYNPQTSLNSGQASGDQQATRKPKPPVSAGVMTPSGKKMGMNSSYGAEQHYRAKGAANSGNPRLENMDMGYKPTNMNPLNIEIGPAGARVVLEDENPLQDV